MTSYQQPTNIDLDYRHPVLTPERLAKLGWSMFHSMKFGDDLHLEQWVFTVAETRHYLTVTSGCRVMLTDDKMKVMYDDFITTPFEFVELMAKNRLPIPNKVKKEWQLTWFRDETGRLISF